MIVPDLHYWYVTRLFVTFEFCHALWGRKYNGLSAVYASGHQKGERDLVGPSRNR